MRLLDLFCGKGGWSRAALARGWECIGVDIECHGYPGRFDQRRLPVTADELRIYGADAVVASPPYEQYARHHLPWIKGPPPDLGLMQWCLTLPGEMNCPVLIECSRFAAMHHAGSTRVGSYALWGDVPALLPEVPRRKMKTSGTDPARRAMIEPALAEWVISYFEQRVKHHLIP